MKSLRLVIISAALMCGMLFAIPAAYAVYTERLELANSKASELPGAGVTLTFTTKDGQTAQVETRKDDDGAVFVMLPGDSASGGTLTVSRTGKEDTDIAIPAHDPDETVVVDLDAGTATVSKPHTAMNEPAPKSEPDHAMPDHNTFVAAGGGADFLDVPETGFGVIIGSSKEWYLVRTKSRIAAPSVGGAVGFGLGHPGWRGELLFNYANGNASSQASEPYGGMDVGIVFSDFGPSSSTGLNLSNVGLDGWTRTSAHSMTFMAKAFYDLCDDEDDDLYWDGFFGFSYQDIGVRQWGYVESPYYGSSIYSETRQRLGENRYGFMAGVHGTYMPDRMHMPGFSLETFGSLELLVHDASLTSMQDNECSLCGSGYPFMVNIHDDHNSFGVGLRAGIGASQQVSENIRIGVVGDLHYVSNAASVFNPQTGDDLFIRNKPTQLMTGGTLDMGVHAFVAFSGL